ncbi:MAG: chemotaxis protein CheA [Desulfobacterales bacterium]|nr:chemotaxis protein CheA [Desulfobacterales bacterium]
MTVLDKNIIDEFVIESRDHLESIEPDLLMLEQEGANVSTEIINRVFRAMHSIKGASSFFGFTSLTSLSHVMENVLMKFREGVLLPNTENIDALLIGVDKVRYMIDDIYVSNNVDFNEELTRLNKILEGNSEKIDERPNTKKEEQEKITETKSASQVNIQHGPVSIHMPDSQHFLLDVKAPNNFEDASIVLPYEYVIEMVSRLLNYYVIWIDVNKDPIHQKRALKEFIVNLEVFGQCYNGITPDSVEQYIKNNVIVYLLGSILGDDLISDALELPNDQIVFIDKAFYQLVDYVDITQKISLPEKIKTQSKIKLTNTTIPKNIQPTEQKPTEPKPIEPKKEPEINRPEDIQVKVQTETVVKQKPKEDVMEPKAHTTESIRVSVELIDRLMNLAGELVLGRNQLRKELESVVSKNPKLGTLMQDVGSVTSEIQEYIMQMRMQPLGNLFNKFTRIVRDIARMLSKEVELDITGKEVELDKTIIEGLSDPLTHLIRNSMDHGIESPEERLRLGKPRVGTIQLKAFHEGGQVNILLTDDGRGIDRAKLVEKALANGIIDSERATKMSESEKMHLILLPGLSTAEKVTDISGRGVGMDVVKTNVEQLGGHLELESTMGKGTNVRIRLPLTLAIIPSLIVGANNLRFAIPQVNVQELILVKAQDVCKRIEKIRQSEVLRLREKLLPLISVAKVLGIERFYTDPATGEEVPDRRKSYADRRQAHFKDPNKKISEKNDQDISDQPKREMGQDRRKSLQSDINVVVLKVGMNNFGLIVDELFDNEEIVVKPLSKHIKECKCFAGATIMGDGRVAMILDATGIAEMSNLNFSDVNIEEIRRKEEEERRLRAVSEHRESILLFTNAINEFFALPLDSISRLEKIKPESIKRIGINDFMDYRNEALPLVYLDKYLPITPFPKDIDEFYLIIPKTQDNLVALVASNILDTMETNVHIRHDKATPKGILGSGFVEGKLTMFLDIQEFMKIIYNNPLFQRDKGVNP